MTNPPSRLGRPDSGMTHHDSELVERTHCTLVGLHQVARSCPSHYQPA